MEINSVARAFTTILQKILSLSLKKNASNILYTLSEIKLLIKNYIKYQEITNFR